MLKYHLSCREVLKRVCVGLNVTTWCSDSDLLYDQDDVCCRCVCLCVCVCVFVCVCLCVRMHSRKGTLHTVSLLVYLLLLVSSGHMSQSYWRYHQFMYEFSGFWNLKTCFKKRKQCEEWCSCAVRHLKPVSPQSIKPVCCGPCEALAVLLTVWPAGFSSPPGRLIW